MLGKACWKTFLLRCSPALKAAPRCWGGGAGSAQSQKTQERSQAPCLGSGSHVRIFYTTSILSEPLTRIFDDAAKPDRFLAALALCAERPFGDRCGYEHPPPTTSLLPGTFYARAHPV